MENIWNQYAGVQDDKDGSAYFLMMRSSDSEIKTLGVERVTVFEQDFMFYEDELLVPMTEVLTSFPFVALTSPMPIELNRSANLVALNTARGRANTVFKTEGTVSIFYRNSNLDNQLDVPVVILRRGSKYAVIQHPNFDNFGYRFKR